MNRHVVVVLLLTFAGCTARELDATYGRRRGDPGAASVNGTAVLASLFEEAGHRVTTWRRLSPKLGEAQNLIWFPDDFAPPTEEQRRYLEKWLTDKSGRTLVYVGRDYDASVAYWKAVQVMAPAEQVPEVSRRLALARAMHNRQRAAIPDGESFEWFAVRRNAPRPASNAELQGAWSTGIDGSKAEIELAGRLETPRSDEIDAWYHRSEVIESRPVFERLLTIGGETAVVRVSWEEAAGSQLLLVANGSFLLNLPLVNHEHRKLARRLIRACGSPARTVFLETGSGGPAIYDTEPGLDSPTGFEVFTVWPLGVILVHLTALGFLACIALFPVFGRPRELPAQVSTDFGKHVEALGELMEDANDPDYAWNKLRTYQEQVRREPGGKLARPN
jgi:hypothetical protein